MSGGLGVQDEARRLAVDVRDRDGVELRLRVGLNSGQVIAGEIGSGPFGYTAVGEQVGMAQRMGIRRHRRGGPRSARPRHDWLRRWRFSRKPQLVQIKRGR